MLVNIINETIVVLINAMFFVTLLINNKLTINIVYILCNVYFVSYLF